MLLLNLLTNTSLFANAATTPTNNAAQTAEANKADANEKVESIKDRDPNQVLAEYKGGKVVRRDIIQRMEAMGVNSSMQQPTKILDDLEHKLAFLVMVQKYAVPLGKKLGLGEKDKTMLQMMEDQAYLRNYLSTEAKKKTTEKDIEKAYEEQRIAMKDDSMYSMGVILVKDMALAKKCIESITKIKNTQEQQAEFVKLVQTHSIAEELKRQNGMLPPLTLQRLEMLVGKEGVKKLKTYASKTCVTTPIAMGQAFGVFYIFDKSKFSDVMKPFAQVKDQVVASMGEQVQNLKKFDVVKSMVTEADMHVYVNGKKVAAKDLPEAVLKTAAM